MMQPTFSIPQDLTFKEFFRATLYYYSTRKLLRILALFLTAMGFLTLYLDMATSPEEPSLPSVLSSFSIVLGLFTVVIIFVFITCLNVYRTKPYLFKDVSYDFTHWGVVRNGEQTEFSKPWREITQVKESKSFFLLTIGRTDFHIIQKRMLVDSDELERFRNLLKENINI